jgi:hypothetical protein
MPEIDRGKEWDRPEGVLPLDPKVAMMMNRAEVFPVFAMATTCKCGGDACGCNELAEALALIIVYMEQRGRGNVLLTQGALRSVRTYYNREMESKAENAVVRAREKYA